MAEQQALVNAVFKSHTIPNRAKSKEAGRPIFDDMEVCEITHPGDRQLKKVFPAHEVWKYQTDDEGHREPVTYAMRFPDQYRAFKNGVVQSAAGTPLEALPFLTPAKRLELKALNIYTAEALAALDGNPLKQLGMGGRELKDQAQAFITTAEKTVDTVKMQSEIDALKAQIAALSSKPEEEAPKGSPFADMDAESIKEWIKDATGARPQGNPSLATLIRHADEINAEIKAKREAEAKKAA